MTGDEKSEEQTVTDAETHTAALVTPESEVDCVEEWGYGSFPASDPPQSWSYEPEGEREPHADRSVRHPAR